MFAPATMFAARVADVPARVEEREGFPVIVAERPMEPLSVAPPSTAPRS
ncbi:MAG TPA: hypothetical protein VNY52_06955 [Solirubrobacteraceae bacterium]|jgi:hypothetical protein|nr:hypothetical protein [Solirubrobacteraceae bacterium]